MSMSRCMMAFAAACLLSPIAFADPWSRPMQPYPAPEAAGLIGNGRLLAAMDARGRMIHCTWPSPSHYLHTDPREPGSGWRLPGEVPDGAQEWRTELVDGVLTQRAEAGGARYEIESLAAPDLDVFLSRLRVTGAAGANEALWLSRLRPAAARAWNPGVVDWPFQRDSGAVWFVSRDGTRLHGFQPADATARDWERMDALTAERAPPPEWPNTAAGVWIMIAVQGGKAAASVRGQDDALETAPTPAPPGQADAALTAEVFVAFAEDPAAAETLLEQALATGYEDLRARTAAHWRATLAPVAEPARKRALHAVLVCRDAAHGGIVRGPTGLALQYPRLGVWKGRALQLAGYPEHNAALLRNLGGALLDSDHGQAAPGSLPGALYADGRPAWPGALLEIEAAAWWLSGLLKHSGELGLPAAAEFLREFRGAIELAADLLVRWTDPRHLAPAPSYAPDLMRNSRDFGLQALRLMGIESAIQIFEALQRPIPEEWRIRQRELQAEVRFHEINRDGEVALCPSLGYWLRGIVREDDRLLALRPIAAGGQPFAETAIPAPPEGTGAAPFTDAWHAALYLLATGDAARTAP